MEDLRVLWYLKYGFSVLVVLLGAALVSAEERGEEEEAKEESTGVEMLGVPGLGDWLTCIWSLS